MVWRPFEPPYQLEALRPPYELLYIIYYILDILYILYIIYYIYSGIPLDALRAFWMPFGHPFRLEALRASLWLRGPSGLPISMNYYILYIIYIIYIIYYILYIIYIIYLYIIYWYDSVYNEGLRPYKT